MQFQELLGILVQDHPDISFSAGDHFAWGSESSQITYKEPTSKSDDNKLSNKLLHELAHAKLQHTDYLSDAELLKIESSAWLLAEELCKKYKVKFNHKEQDESLTSYINWASSRSQCPECRKNGLQTASTKFTCPNCSHKWNVGTSRFTRTYRQS